MSAKNIHKNGRLTGAGIDAERRTFEFLKPLPSDCWIIRECKVRPSEEREMYGSREDRLDFVIVGPTIGVVVLEVKDWDIHNKCFEFVDNYQVRKTDLRGNIEDLLRNPYDQIDEYVRAIKGALSENQPKPNDLWISGFVVYPKLSRADFENRCRGIQKTNPQQRFSYDSNRTLFQDELEKYRDEPLELLEQIVVREARLYQHTPRIYTEQQVNAAVYYLVPSEMCVGGLPDDPEAERNFALLDRQQQEWAFSDAVAEKTYLADVAGSGKTNVLLSRAIYKAKQHISTGGCRILIVTYSKALKQELERIFDKKVVGDSNRNYYYEAIQLYDIEGLMEDIVRNDMGDRAFEAWKKQCLVSQEGGYVDDILVEQCDNFLRGVQKIPPFYDYLFIDEIQDFSTAFLVIAMELLKDHKNVFAVGDIGQKLFDRKLDWSELDIVRQRAELQSRFLMYRSPQPVARLAWKFLTSDRLIAEDIKEEGYKMDIKPKSPFTYNPVFISSASEEALSQCVLEDVHKYLCLAEPKQILCIGLKDKMLGKLYQYLVSHSVAVRWATEVPRDGNYLVLADYVEAKGLERDYVYIVDADELARKTGVFVTDEQIREEVKRDRIKLFVALTRAIQEVRIYYVNRNHTFIKQLLQLQG